MVNRNTQRLEMVHSVFSGRSVSAALKVSRTQNTRITRGDEAGLGLQDWVFVPDVARSALDTSRKRKSQLWIFLIGESTCTLRDLVHPGSEAHPMNISSSHRF